MATSQASATYDVYDLDTDSSYKTLLTRLMSADCGNFALSFDHQRASVSTDLDRNSLRQWLDRDHKNAVRWIHFWSNADQKPMIEDLASRYGISPRLLSLICPHKPSARVSQSTSSPPDSTHNHLPRRFTWSPKTKDIERAVELPKDKGTNRAHVLTTKDLSFPDIVNNLWHFHSVDWGHRYVHIGVNILSVIPGLEHEEISDRPEGQRLWTSILLCDDGTVISSFERPPHYDSNELNGASNEVVKRHVLNIVKHLSRLPDAHSSGTGDLMSVTIRPERAATSDPNKQMSKSERMEHASLLFYYLFDDWMTTFALIAQREHPYRRSIEMVRQALADAPDAKLLEVLHSIGRQLTVLQLMYQSYGTVIFRLLRRYQSTTYTATDLNGDNSSPQQGTGYDGMLSSVSSTYQSSILPSGGQDCIHSVSTRTPTVQLSFLAIGRFERLLDRVHLYALNEINHCLAEKESLVLMTFNLLALSESRSVEKLTRTTILLAKATILFLPASLLTAYFSLSIGNIDTLYSLKTYWLSFLVVVIVSVVFLYLFGFATGTIEGKLVYRSLHRTLWDKSIAAVLRRSGRASKKAC